MHLYFTTRGIKHCVDQLINDLQAQPFPFWQQDKDTLVKTQNTVQGALRPIQLWEYVFPEPSLPTVLKMLAIPNKAYPEMNKQKWALRKALKADPIPEMDLSKEPSRFLRKDWVSIMGIGIKKDITRTVADKYIQEAL